MSRKRITSAVDLTATAYSATQYVADKALYTAKAKRLPLTAVQEEWSRLLAHANALSKRQARARQAKDDRKLGVLLDLEQQACVRLQELAAKMVELGGAVIHPKVEEQNRKLANWRAKDVRRHTERKASPVRYVTMPDAYPYPEKKV